MYSIPIWMVQDGLLCSTIMKVMGTENTQIIILNMFLRLEKLTGQYYHHIQYSKHFP